MNDATRLPPPKLLIVDDDPASLRLTATVLGEFYEIIAATNGPDALALAAESPTLILLDMHMEGMDGFETCRRLKADPRMAGIPVIFITANRDPQTEELGISLGAVDFITKPYSVAVLRARVKTHVDLKRKTDLLEHLALQDGLTEIANRRHFDSLLNEEWRRHGRENRPLSLIMADIDHFKKINDNYGHKVGDECLRRVAAVMAAAAKRGGDVAARYGGEEFALLLPDTEAAGALNVAEDIRERVKAIDLSREYGKDYPRLTLSAGCAALIPKDGIEASVLIEAADHWLYQAKAKGRNRVEPQPAIKN